MAVVWGKGLKNKQMPIRRGIAKVKPAKNCSIFPPVAVIILEEDILNMFLHPVFRIHYNLSG
jgi:hypothetical protein